MHIHHLHRAPLLLCRWQERLRAQRELEEGISHTEDCFLLPLRSRLCLKKKKNEKKESKRVTHLAGETGDGGGGDDTVEEPL